MKLTQIAVGLILIGGVAAFTAPARAAITDTKYSTVNTGNGGGSVLLSFAAGDLIMIGGAQLGVPGTHTPYLSFSPVAYTTFIEQSLSSDSDGDYCSSIIWYIVPTSNSAAGGTSIVCPDPGNYTIDVLTGVSHVYESGTTEAASGGWAEAHPGAPPFDGVLPYGYTTGTATGATSYVISYITGFDPVYAWGATLSPPTGFTTVQQVSYDGEMNLLEEISPAITSSTYPVGAFGYSGWVQQWAWAEASVVIW